MRKHISQGERDSVMDALRSDELNTCSLCDPVISSAGGGKGLERCHDQSGGDLFCLG